MSVGQKNSAKEIGTHEQEQNPSKTIHILASLANFFLFHLLCPLPTTLRGREGRKKTKMREHERKEVSTVKNTKGNLLAIVSGCNKLLHVLQIVHQELRGPSLLVRWVMVFVFLLQSI